MNYFEEYQDNKIKYESSENLFEGNINKPISKAYSNINKIINTLDNFYSKADEIANRAYNLNQSNQFNKFNQSNHFGGSAESEENEVLRHKVKKYKKLIENSKNSILYFKTMAEKYYSAYYYTQIYYCELLRQLQVKKAELTMAYNAMYSFGADNNMNKEKIRMLELMIAGLEHFTKNINVDLDLKSTLDLNGKKFSQTAQSRINGKVVDNAQTTYQLGGLQNGGALSFGDFEDAVAKSVSEFQVYTDGLQDDSNFVKNKIDNLRQRMQKIVSNDEQLFKIRANVEWIVNKLEDKQGFKPVEEKDYDALLKQVKDLLEMGKKGKLDEELVNYIADLEKYAAYLEVFIRSTGKTITGLSDMNKKSADVHYKEGMEMVGGKLQRGGSYKTLKSIYDENVKTRVEKIFESLKSSDIKHIEVNLDNIKKENFDLKYYEESPIAYGNLITIRAMIYGLDM
jgi:hypothetical protein